MYMKFNIEIRYTTKYMTNNSKNKFKVQEILPAGFK